MLEANFFASSPHLFKYILQMSLISLMDTQHESPAAFSLSKLCQLWPSGMLQSPDGTQSFSFALKPSNHQEIAVVRLSPILMHKALHGTNWRPVAPWGLHSVVICYQSFCSYESSNHRTEEESRKHRSSLIWVQTEGPLSSI